MTKYCRALLDPGNATATQPCCLRSVPRAVQHSTLFCSQWAHRAALGGQGRAAGPKTAIADGCEGRVGSDLAAGSLQKHSARNTWRHSCGSQPLH